MVSLYDSLQVEFAYTPKIRLLDAIGHVRILCGAAFHSEHFVQWQVSSKIRASNAPQHRDLGPRALSIHWRILNRRSAWLACQPSFSAEATTYWVLGQRYVLFLHHPPSRPRPNQDLFISTYLACILGSPLKPQVPFPTYCKS